MMLMKTHKYNSTLDIFKLNSNKFENQFTPGNLSTCTPTVYCKEISGPVPVDLLTCVNNFPEC